MANNESKGIIPWVDTLKGACILLVVLHHSIVTTLIPSIEYLSAGAPIAKAWILFNQSISPLRMPAFFFVSGLLSSNAVKNKKWSDVFTKKVSNLFYLYVLWTALQWLFIKKIITEPLDMQLSNAANSAYATSFLDYLNLIFMASTSLWYLYALALYFIIAKIFNSKGYIIFTAAIAFNYAAGLGLVKLWGISSIAQNLIFFLIGVHFYNIVINLSELKNRNVVFWIGIIALAGLNIALGINKNLFSCLLAIIFSIFICRAINKKINTSSLDWIGKNTLQIYVIHRIFIEVLGITLLKTSIENNYFELKWFSTAWAITYPLFSVIICTASSLIVWRIINKGIGRIFFSLPKLTLSDK